MTYMQRSRLNRIVPILFLILSTLLCYLSIDGQSIILHADFLSPLSLSLEVSEGLDNLRYWNYSGYTAWFPDVASVVLLAQFFGRSNILLANLVWGLIQIGLFQYCNIRLIGLITNSKGKEARVFRVFILASLSMLLFFTLSDRRLLYITICPIIHIPAFLLSLFSLVVYFELAGERQLLKDRRNLIVLTALSIVLVTLSDPFFLLFGGFPLAISHFVFRFFKIRIFENRLARRFDNRQLDLFSGIVLASSILGYGLYKLTPVSNSAYFERSLEGSFQSAQNLVSQLFASPQTLLILVVVVCLLFFIFIGNRTGNWLSESHEKTLSSKLDVELFSFYIVFVSMSTALCFAAVIVYGMFLNTADCFRYTQLLIFCPPVFMGITLSLATEDLTLSESGLKNLRRSTYFILAVILAVDLTLADRARQEYASHNSIHDQNLACIQSLGVKYYAAEYWWAKPVHVLSEGEIKPIQLTAEADYFPWVNSERWYKDLNDLDGPLGVLVEAQGKQLIDREQVVRKTSASIPKQCGDLQYLVSDGS